jgi:NAD(P)-dependent dehydrogenase (short-subunit alcohol dehydrogenase family)
MTIEGRVCVVTGATGGMGVAIARTFVERGARVVVTDRSTELVDALVTQLQDAGGSIVGVAGDITHESTAADLVQTAVARFGRLDAAVNAAAIELETVPLADCPDDVFDSILAVNVRGVFTCMKHQIRSMQNNAGDRRGSIVNIASTNSFRPQPNQPAYTASKHAVLGLTRSAALDYASIGIRVNAICPGAIDTPMLRGAIDRRGRDPDEVAARLSRMRRFGTPEEIAEAAWWLCSDASSFTTGHALAVDGGMLGA